MRKEGESDRDFEERQALARRLSGIKHKILVLSGKGGVGKSTVAASLAVALSQSDRRVGLLDIDLHGPSIPTLLGLVEGRVTGAEGSIQPAQAADGLKVMSMGFLLPKRDDALIWRGPLKYKMIQQFLRDVEWGELDYLIVDSPPGTGDEPLSIGQLVEDADGAVIVTTPQALSISDVRKSVNFARQLNLPVLGIIENMSGFVCPECGAEVDVFGSGGGKDMAADMGVPFLGTIPIDAAMVPAGDKGELPSYLAGDSPGARAFGSVIERLARHVEQGERDSAAGRGGGAEEPGTAEEEDGS
ncbi:MAG: P-loop NTPase [Candidatus Eisenbacteria bacterium]|nr:P-loop NTPase [Candidatus Eisenbacteria bacterium]